MMKNILIYGTILVVLTGGAGFAADFTKSGAVGAQFLKIGVGSRYQGLGEASVAIVNDAYSLYWNPAGLAYIEGTAVTFTNVNWVTDISLNYVAVGTQVENFGAIGFAASLMSMGEMEVTTVDEPDGTGEMFSATSLALTAGYARFLTTRLSFGASIKYVYEKIYREAAGGIAFDFGTQLRTGFKSLRIGMNISNLGPELQFSGPDLNVALPTSGGSSTNGNVAVDQYELPLTFRLGMAFDVLEDAENRWTVSLEAKHPNDNDQQASLGTEYCFQERYFLRAGYKVNYEEQGLTLGGGLNTALGNDKNLVIDYAWSDFGRLESVHRFSVGFEF
jgi:long-subunit fatty acid transport protein